MVVQSSLRFLRFSCVTLYYHKIYACVDVCACTFVCIHSSVLTKIVSSVAYEASNPYLLSE